MALIQKNIVNDFGAVGDGATNVASAFKSFNDWAIANQGSDSIQLNVPAGSFYFATNAGPGNNNFTKGIKNLVVAGAGSGVTTLTSIGGFGFTFGGQATVQKGIADAAGKSARIQTVAAGATSITLTAASFASGHISRFSVGDCALIGGLNIQALWNAPFGFPTNVHWFEYVLITAVDAVLGTISFTAFNTGAGLQYSYKSTWPLYNGGSSTEVDAGGPATIWWLDPSWNVTQEVRDLTLNQSGQINSNGKNITFRNCVSVLNSGQDGPIPSQNLLWQAIACDYSGIVMEVDKLITTMRMDSVTIDQVKFQSSSIDLFDANNLTVTTTVSGHPKNATVSNSNIADISIGAYAYGASSQFSCSNSVLGAVRAQGISQNISASDYSLTAGVLSFPNTSASGPSPSQEILVPGTVLFWSGDLENMGSFRVGDVTQDASNVYAATSLSGGFPPLPGLSGIRTAPSANVTFSGCTGCPEAVSLSLAPPGAPLWSYSKYTYSPSTQGVLGSQKIWGRLVYLKINVITPYVGAGSATLNPTGQFHNLTIKSDSSEYDYVPVIDLKVAGERVITAQGVTGSGGADSNLSIPEAIWFADSLGPYLNQNLSAGAPTFTIEIKTDQGFIPVAVVPLRLRLHA